MIVWFTSLILMQLVISARGAAASIQEEGSECTTPNNETGTCTKIDSCQTVLDALASKTDEAVNFARNAHCGFAIKEPMVCCGYGDLSESPIYQHELLPTSLQCGMEINTYAKLPKLTTEKEEDGVSGISRYGGVASSLNEHPWMALLKYSDEGQEKFLCGGSLISHRYVLTAAHCTKFSPNSDRKLIGVRLGEQIISKDVDCQTVFGREICADPVVDVGIEEVIIHPNYKKKLNIHDISMIRLDRDVSYTDFIQPICLPVANKILSVSTEVTVAGWGETEKSAWSDVKLHGAEPVTSPVDCGMKLGTTIQQYQFCAGGKDNHDSCKGDSGGPAMRQGTDTDVFQWVQEGIVSYGLNDCGVEGYSSVYTRVSKYVEWIANNLRP